MAEPTDVRWRDEAVTFAGIEGENLAVRSANPRNFHAAITDPTGVEPVEIDGKLFLQAVDQPQPVVMLVPGSLGVGPNHRLHAERLLGEGFGVFVLDPFGARSVTSTVANQTHYSFAASGFDVLAAWRTLAADERIDAARISAQGHSRGGSAVLTAAMRRFADPIVGVDGGLAAVYGVYPWCGQLFRDARVGNASVRAIIGDLDEWCSWQQVQGQIHAIASTGADATLRIVPGAHHSFDRLQDLELLDDARVAPAAPAVFVEDDGAMTSPYLDGPSAEITDYDVFVAAMRAGHGRVGARIGSAPGQPELFAQDMVDFHRRTLLA